MNDSLMNLFQDISWLNCCLVGRDDRPAVYIENREEFDGLDIIGVNETHRDLYDTTIRKYVYE